MNEEDTFNALKKWTFKEAYEFYMSCTEEDPRLRRFTEITHWQWKDFSDEYYRQTTFLPIGNH